MVDSIFSPDTLQIIANIKDDTWFQQPPESLPPSKLRLDILGLNVPFYQYLYLFFETLLPIIYLYPIITYSRSCKVDTKRLNNSLRINIACSSKDIKWIFYHKLSYSSQCPYIKEYLLDQNLIVWAELCLHSRIREKIHKPTFKILSASFIPPTIKHISFVHNIYVVIVLIFRLSSLKRKDLPTVSIFSLWFHLPLKLSWKIVASLQTVQS
jgi:hypothetical protein